MTDFFIYLHTHRGGILVLLLCLTFLTLLAHWLAWIFSLGRFSSSAPPERGRYLRYVFSDAMVKIIDDFRHLLALIIVCIFALALGYGMIQAKDSNDMKEALQTVVATLGGLVGSIIGYYFGESTVSRTRGAGPPGDGREAGAPSPAVQQLPTPSPTPSPAPPPREP